MRLVPSVRCACIPGFWKSFFHDRRGNVALVFALTAVPMLLAVGAGLDLTRAYNVQNKMQADLDAALVAAVKQIDNQDEEQIKEKIADWFNALADRRDSSYDLSTIKVDKSGHTITASAAGTVPTTFMKIANFSTVPVGVVSAIKGPATSYLDVYIVIDKSPSMLLASTTAGQQLMRSTANCEFACHSTADPVTVAGQTYGTFYDYSTAAKVKLRSDTALEAAEKVIDMIEESDPGHQRIKVGLYGLGSGIDEALPVTLSTTTARKTLTNKSSGLTSATSQAATYFDTALSQLLEKIGEPGDGTSSSSPLKLVLLLTDGVQSERNWVVQSRWGQTTRWPTSLGNLRRAVTPLNPDWCSPIKDNGATIAVLYTEYLAITADWGYNATLGQPMSNSVWESVWGGTLANGTSSSTVRRDYIPTALQGCASTSDLFISAASEDEITEGLSALFKQYLTSVRLTQ